MVCAPGANPTLFFIFYLLSFIFVDYEVTSMTQRYDITGMSCAAKNYDTAAYVNFGLRPRRKPHLVFYLLSLIFYLC